MQNCFVHLCQTWVEQKCSDVSQQNTVVWYPYTCIRDKVIESKTHSLNLYAIFVSLQLKPLIYNWKQVLELKFPFWYSLVHTVPDFSPGVSTVWTPSQLGPHHSDTGKHRIESGYTVLIRRSPEMAPVFLIFKTTGTHRGAKHRRLIPGHHRGSSGLIRLSTVRPPGETAVNQHELCPRWRYGDSRFSHSLSRRRADVALTLGGRTTVWHFT